MFELMTIDNWTRNDATADGSDEIELNRLEAAFAGQLATAVWIGQLTDTGAREAILSYAIASHFTVRTPVMRLNSALLAEYRHWRERQELVS